MKFIYAKTYDNVIINDDSFPVEDAYWYHDNCCIVADGITRDPVRDKGTYTFEELVEKYPRPSGATIAANTICDSFKKNIDSNKTLKKLLLEANKQVKNNNVKEVDYLVNDYYGAVAACFRVEDNILCYAYIGDCGVIVFDKNGNIKFQTEDDVAKVRNNFDTKGATWGEAEARIIVRRDYRNKPDNIYSYGALTGEEEVEHYIKEGTIELSEGDYIIVYSDGFADWFMRENFFDKIKNFNEKEFNEYITKIDKDDYKKLGSERTILLFKY